MSTNAATPKVQITKGTATVFKNIVLEGVETLKADKITTTFEVKYKLGTNTNQQFKVVSRKQLKEVVEHMPFNLVEVTSEELAGYRRSGISSFVLKVDGKLYYSKIPNNISFVSSNILVAHSCATAGKECQRLSAASDEQGGCAKVRDRSKRIEKYPWITTGYETFNTKHDSFVVVNCLHYEKCPPRKKLSIIEINSARLGLAQFVWDDVRTI